MRLHTIGISVLLAAVLLAAPAFAIAEPFSISGKVLDRYGSPMQGANATLIDNNYNVIKVMQTTENGYYDFINVVSNTDTVTVWVNLTKGGKTYEIPSYYTRWYPSKGMQFVNGSETTFPDYPDLVFGYVYGAIQTDPSNIGRFIDGVVYLMGLSDSARYYEFATRTDGKGSYQFYVPAGSYMINAQHYENGVVYQSPVKQITIKPNANVAEVLETRIVLSLDKSASSPNPAALPTAHNQNKVSGIVISEDGKPLTGVTVTLYQMADNGTTFIPMMGSGARPLATTTDANGNYAFSSVSPTTNDGQTIQGKKDIRVVADYALTDNLTFEAVSDTKALYYPDVILGYGQEIQARNVTLPVVFSLESPGAEKPPQATVTVSDASPAPSNVAVIPLVAALAVGLVCLGGLYMVLNRKG